MDNLYGELEKTHNEMVAKGEIRKDSLLLLYLSAIYCKIAPNLADTIDYELEKKDRAEFYKSLPTFNRSIVS